MINLIAVQRTVSEAKKRRDGGGGVEGLRRIYTRIKVTREISNNPCQKICTQLRCDSLTYISTLLLPLDNFPPKILSGPSEVNLTVNTTVSITVTAEDPNDDPMTFNITGSLPKGAKISTNASSVTLTWNVTTEEVTNQN